MELRRIDTENVWKIVGLVVAKSQESFVATNAESIIEAYAAEHSGGIALPLGIYEDGVPIGFVMLGYGSIGDEEEPISAKDSYCIWRFMIDERYQGCGRGKAALAEVLHYIRTFPLGPATGCWLSYEPENEAAKKLYAKFGFRETGETDGEEVVAYLSF